HLGREVGAALDAIHDAGVVHRDLKPENILITFDESVKVMDLGVAHLQDEATRLTRTGAFIGSFQYAAPEQLSEGGTAIDGRADLFALGVTLFEAVTGRHPHGKGDFGTTLRRVLFEDPPRASSLHTGISPFFEEVIHRLLARDKDARFPTAREVVDILTEGEQCTWWRCRAQAIQQQEHRPLRRIRMPRETDLFGRDAELNRLRDQFDRVRDGRGCVLLMEGEAGIGKTRLIDEFVSRLESEEDAGEFHFLHGSYPPIGAAAAAGAFSTAYREHLGSAALEDALKVHLDGDTSMVPAFAALLRGDSLPRGGDPLTRDALSSLFVRITRHMAAEKPTILFVDDLHFAPEQGRSLFAVLALAAADLRVMLVGASRPGLPRDWVSGVDHFDHASRMTLPRLGPRDLSKLLCAALGSEHLAEELGFSIARKSDGNPFFVFEVLRGLREGQFLTQQEDGTWEKSRVIQDVSIPSSIVDLIQARIQDLDEADRDLLDVASCCGYEFDPLVVGEVLGVAPIPLLKRLGRLEREHRLVRSEGVKCIFDHHQVQEALYEGLSELLRREYHGALAGSLERRTGATDKDPEDLDGAVATSLAEHYLRAHHAERSLRYLKKALDYLEESYLTDKAVELVERAERVPGLLQADGRLHVLSRKAGRLELLGRWEEERNALDLALLEADKSGDGGARARIRRRLGRHLCRMAEYTPALEVLEESLALARESGDLREEGATLSALGVVCWQLGRFEDATEYHERTMELAGKVDGIETDSYATGNLPELYASLGRADEARKHTEQQLEIAREISDLRGEAIAMGNLGGILYDQGEYGQARGAFERALELARKIGDRRGESRASGNLGRVLRDEGHPGEALEHLERCLAIAREIGYRRGEARAMSHLGRLSRDLGQREDAKRYASRYLKIARHIGARSEEAHALRDLAVLAWEGGDDSGAERAFEESLSLWSDTAHLKGRASTHVAFAGYLAHVERRHEAIRHLEEATALAEQSGAADEAVLASVLRAS
ncbi:MAG: ATP-binding protein, partial [Planctomycetota bacterium]